MSRASDQTSEKSSARENIGCLGMTQPEIALRLRPRRREQARCRPTPEAADSRFISGVVDHARTTSGDQTIAQEELATERLITLSVHLTRNSTREGSAHNPAVHCSSWLVGLQRGPRVCPAGQQHSHQHQPCGSMTSSPRGVMEQ